MRMKIGSAYRPNRATGHERRGVSGGTFRNLSLTLQLPTAAKPLACAVAGTIVIVMLAIPARAGDKRDSAELASIEGRILWSNPTDIATRDLFYGPGGMADEPHSTYTFMKEDPKGTNPKFDVRDENGNKWRVKLGPESKPEVVASRLVWAVGYVTNEDYFVRDLKVEAMQPLKRGRKLVGRDGTMHNARLKRYLTEKKAGAWEWRDNPFRDTRELNGLRVMMALINNWDLKDENNSIYEEQGDHPILHYVVSDLGSSFGTTGLSYPHSRSKGNLSAYAHSPFIEKIGPEYVDFAVPSRPSLWNVVGLKHYISRLHLRWIGRRIPKSDARWIGGLLAQLSPEQIRQAFRAANYSPDEVEAFSAVVEKRIRELNQL